MKRALTLQTFKIDEIEDNSCNVFLYKCKSKQKATKNAKYTLYLERGKQIIGKFKDIIINQQKRYHFIQNFKQNAINLDIFRNRRRLIVQWSLYQQIKVQIQGAEREVEILLQQVQIDIGKLWKTHSIENNHRQFNFSFPKVQIQFNFFILFSINQNTMQNLSREINSQKAIFCYSPKNTNLFAKKIKQQKSIQEISNPQYIINNLKQEELTIGSYSDDFRVSNYKQLNNQFITSFTQSQVHSKNNYLTLFKRVQSSTKQTINFFSLTQQYNQKDPLKISNENKKRKVKKSRKNQKKHLKNMSFYGLILLFLIFCLSLAIAQMKKLLSQ